MCGIIGIVRHSGSLPQDGKLVELMARAIASRGPDDHGLWQDGAVGVTLGHRRLSILDLSAEGHQPMLSDDGRYVIVFNGEVYNYRELRARLEREGLAPDWRGSSDTEVILAAISAWGLQNVLELSVGMFAFALWDRYARRLYLVRDRLGEKPLYFMQSDKCFAFASELKALRQLPEVGSDVDRDSLTLFLRYGYIPAPFTIYPNVRKLGPGQYLTLGHDCKEARVTTYWSAAAVYKAGQEAPFVDSIDEAGIQLEALIRQSLAGQMVADVPLGAFLSGGIDSSTVVAIMQSMSASPIKTFTIGFHDQNYNEAIQAKEIAKHLGTDHTELYVSEKEALDVIPGLAHIYCEPFADASQIPTLLLSRLAREHVTVSLSGDGGDELFSGYRRYALSDDFWSLLSRLPVGLRRAIQRAVLGISPACYDTLSNALNYLLPVNRRLTRLGDRAHKAANLFACTSQDALYLAMLSFWSNPAGIVIGASEPSTALSGSISLPYVSDSQRRMMFADLITYLPDDILVKIDRASMAVGLEARVPLLDHRIVEFSASLPMSYLRRNGQGKWLMRSILNRYVPRSLFDRPKMGFGVPLDSWLRGRLRDWAEAHLDEGRLSREGIFDPVPIRKAWELHQSGARNLQYPLWCVLMFQSWYEEVNR